MHELCEPLLTIVKMRLLVLEMWTHVVQRCLCWLTWVWIWFTCHFLITTPFPILSYKAKTLKINTEDATQELTVIYILLFKIFCNFGLHPLHFYCFMDWFNVPNQHLCTVFLLRSASLSADCYGYESYVTALIFTSTGPWEKHLHCIFELWHYCEFDLLKLWCTQYLIKMFSAFD